MSTAKKKKEVLDEELYVEKLDDIIQRDYFPEVPKLKAQCEYLDALEKNDSERIRQLQMKYSSRRSELVKRKQTPMFPPDGKDSPAAFETPLRGVKRPATGHAWEAGDTPVVQDGMKSEGDKGDDRRGDKEEEPKHTVTSFLAKYTSEDNESFQDLQELERKRLDAKFGWMKRSEDEHEARFGTNAIEGPEKVQQDAIEGRTETWHSYKARNAVLWLPEDAPLTFEESDSRHKKASAKQIIRENTRLPSKLTRHTRTGTPATPALDPEGTAPLKGKGAGGDYVVTPSPMPGVNESPMMTWGEIEGTPFLLDASDVPVDVIPGPTFKMPEIPKRDKLAMSLTEETAKQHRQRKQKVLSSVSRGTPKFANKKSMERISSMSPAARRLATSKLGIRLGTDKALKASYTPSPSRHTPRTPVVGSKTPKTTPSSLTANLLKIRSSPATSTEKDTNRPKAVDYF